MAKINVRLPEPKKNMMSLTKNKLIEQFKVL